ncbi:hypothetical protein JXQ70_02545, partial [bacterium]|nr:hypothetical protein [bacterium]
IDDVVVGYATPFSAGQINFDATSYMCNGDAVGVEIADRDLSGSALAAVTTTGGDSETVTCLETACVFQGSVPTATGAVIPGDGILQVGHADTITASYDDADDGTGNPATVYDTATLDCTGPIISNVQAINISLDNADIVWDTDEEANSLIIYDIVTPPLTNSQSDEVEVTSHSLHVADLSQCTAYYYYVQSTDNLGNTTIDDNGGAYYIFRTLVYRALFVDDMESGPDNWAADAPWAISSESSNSPINAWSDSPGGNYNNNLDISLMLNPLDLSSYSNADVTFWQTYNINTGDNGYLEISIDGSIWTNLATFSGTQTAWTQMSYDLSPYLGNPAVQVRFRLLTNASTVRDGWHIDDVVVSYAMPLVSTGQIFLDDIIYNCSSDMVNITLADLDLSGSATVEVTAASGDSETVICFDAGCLFEGSITTAYGAAIPGDGTLQVVHADTITATYYDADDGTGNPATVQETATMDCAGPVITNVQAINITLDSSEIVWNTDQAADSLVIFEDAVPPVANSEYYWSNVTDHSVPLSNLSQCTTYYFSVQSTDMYGNTTIDDNGGAYYSFRTLVHQSVFSDDMEVGPDKWVAEAPWTISDEASHSASNGWSDSPGGNYNNNIDVSLTSDPFDLAGLSDANLSFWHMYNIYAGDYGYLEIMIEGATWTNIATFTGTQTSWTLENYDLSPYLGNSSVQIRFRLQTNNTGTRDGWHIDDVDVGYSIPFPAGQINLDKTGYRCTSDTVYITIADLDLSSSAIAELITASGDSETVTCLETACVFEGAISTSPETAIPGNGILEVDHADTITATYYDADDGTGNPVTVQDVAILDCLAPVITNVQVINITLDSAEIHWETDKAADSLVIFENSLPPVTNSEYDYVDVTDHAVPLVNLSQCTTYYFSVQSTDIYGNTTIDDNGGVYYNFQTLFHRSIFSDDIETGPDKWTAEAPWAISNEASNSPSNAWSDSPGGNYGNNINVSLTSDPFDLSLLSNADLTFWHIYTLYSGDYGYLEITTDGTNWTSLASFTGTLSVWTQMSYDLTPFLGNASVQVRFRLLTNASATRDGWHIDDVTVGYVAPCVPEAGYGSHTFIDDCPSGPGDENSVLDAGETAVFLIDISNVGDGDLANVWAELSTTTPGVTILDNQADYPTISHGDTVTSLGPHFTVSFDPGLACGTTVDFVLDIHTSEGDFSDNFSDRLGSIISGNFLAISQDFEGSFPPAGWTVINNSGSDWDRNDALGQVNYTTANGGAGFCAAAGQDGNPGSTWDTELWSPPVDLTNALSAQVTYASNFKGYAGNDSIYLDISLDGGNNWTNLRTQTIDDPVDGTLEIEDLGAFLGNTVLLRWHYVAPATTSYYWHIDNILLEYTAQTDCTMNVCSTGGGTAVTVADGTEPGTNPMTATKSGSIIITWDAITPNCSSTGYHLIWGWGNDMATYTISGADCTLDTAGTHDWTGSPDTTSDWCWFLIVGNDGASEEGGWGTNSNGVERSSSASGECSTVTIDTTPCVP